MYQMCVLQFFMWTIAGLVLGADIAPPDVPNPYGTSEGRAIRDVMTETYHQKLSDKLPLKELQAAYRKAWNDDQLNRYDSGRDLSPQWLAAYQQEEDSKARKRLVNDLTRLGGQADDTMDVAALERAIADRKSIVTKEKSVLAEAEIAKRREDASRQIEGEQKNDTDRSSGKGKQVIALSLYVTSADLMSDEDVTKTYIAAHFKPDSTALERKGVEARAKMLVDERQSHKKMGWAPAMVSGT